MPEGNTRPVCPGCGGELRLDAGSPLLECPHCGAKAAPAPPTINLPLPDADDRAEAALPPSAEATIADTSRPAPPRPEEPGGDGDEAPRLFARYEILGELGRGGMGIVYRARDTTLGRIVALKVLIAGEDASRQEVERFFREAEASAKLKHPNIIPIHELDVFEGRHYFTMDYVEGAPLDAVLGKGDVDPFRAMRFMEKIARAVHHAHSEGIVHRDLKPSNVIVRADGEPMVMDFGLAKQVQADSSLTQSGVFMGTPSYASPEQAEGRSREVDACSDVFSLGSMLYEMLTGRVPFLGGSTLAVLREITDSEPAAPRRVDRRVPRDAEVICLKCLEKDPERRYRSAEALADDCRRFLANEPIAARPASLLYRARKRLARHKALTAVSAVALAAIAGLAAWLVPGFLAEREAREALERKAEEEAAREWHLVFEDDFSDPDVEERWEFGGGRHGGKLNWELGNGELRMWGAGPQIAAIRDPIVGDVRIEFECRQESDRLTDVSCFMCATSGVKLENAVDDAYVFQYGGRGNTRNVLDRCGQKNLHDEQASPLRRGERYCVRAERKGGLLTLVVNGRTVFEVTDPEPLSGKARARVGFYGWVADTYYDNVRVYTLGPPRKADLLELAQEYLDRGRYSAAEDIFRDVAAAAIQPERKEMAEAGLATAARLRELSALIPGYRERLENAWPGTGECLRIGHEGLFLGISRKGIEDLEPIRGMQIGVLHCSGNRIRSLEPLSAMPLTELGCGSNEIASLEPLSGIPLTHLWCAGNRIRSLEPLSAMPLTELGCEGNEIASLEPLRGIPLTHLRCAGNRIRDLGPLEGMPLEGLQCHENRITKLDPLRGMPLVKLVCSHNTIASLEPLAGMPLTYLNVRDNRVSDLRPLAGMRLTYLSCAGNDIASLEPLKGMMLDSLSCDGNRIASLEPLSGMSLRTLWCSDNPIASLEPLRGMPLENVGCYANGFTGLEPLRGMPLGHLDCSAGRLANLGPFVATAPPQEFLWYSESLPTAEIVRARDAWAGDPASARHARNAELILAVRAGAAERLRNLADEFGGHRYLSVPIRLAWGEAHGVCTKLGGHLVTITSREEDDLVTKLVTDAVWESWIGLTCERNAGVWEWVTGEPVTLTKLASLPVEAGGRSHWAMMIPGQRWRWIAADGPAIFVIEWDD